jgi:hypothetical protein
MPNNASWDNADGESEAPEFSGSGGVLQDGIYSFNIEKVELKQSSASGKKYVNFWLKELSNGNMVFYPIYASKDYAEHKNQQWAQQQINALKRLFMVSGVKPPSAMPTPSDLQMLKDARIDAKVIIEQDQEGRDQNKILDCYPCSNTTQEPESGGVIDGMDDDIPF